MEGRCRCIILMYYPGIHLEKLRKTKINLTQENRSPGRDLNSKHSEYEAGVLNTRPRRSVIQILSDSYSGAPSH
jgi:hypothetical protein